MTDPAHSRTVLSYPYAMDVLDVLHRSGGESKMTWIKDSIGHAGYDSVGKAVSRLESSKLLTTRRVPGRGSYIEVKLTEEGKRVAEQASELINMVREVAGEMSPDLA